MEKVFRQFDPEFFVGSMDQEIAAIHRMRFELADPEHFAHQDADLRNYENARIARKVKRLISSVVGALDILHAHVTRDKFVEESNKFYVEPMDLGEYGDLNQYLHPLDTEFLDLIERYLDVISDLTGFGRKGFLSSKREVVLDILRNTPKIVAKLPTPPKTEPQLNRALFDYFSIAFTDSENDQRGAIFRRGGRVYKPDLTIPSLHLCVEYKYANSDDEFGRELDQIVEDVINFGDRHYTSFIGFMYTAGSCLKHEPEFLELIARKTYDLPRRSQWTFLLVQGTGGRVVRTPQGRNPRRRKALKPGRPLKQPIP